MKYRKILEKLQPYKPGKSTSEIRQQFGLDNITKLASNENPYGASPNVKKEVANIDNIEIYPDNYVKELREQLAKKHNVAKEKIIFGNGSVEIIQMLCRVLLDKSDEVITCVPSFQSYNSETLLQDATIIEVPLLDYTFDLDGMLAKINEKTKIIFITNPNNPTGTIVTKTQLEAFIQKVPSDILVVMDEAYFEYVTDAKYPNTIELLDHYKNICIIRTFSKAYGLASLRIGYGIANEELITQLEKSRVPFNISTIAQKAAIAALNDQDFVDMVVQKNEQTREYTYKMLDNAGIEYIKSQANFIMINVQTNGNDVFQKLLSKGYIVRPGFPKMENYIRVTIGTNEQMEGFIEALKTVINERN